MSLDIMLFYLDLYESFLLVKSTLTTGYFGVILAAPLIGCNFVVFQ